MSANEKVIFVAQTPQEAHFLKNVLVDAGISAVVQATVIDGGTGLGNGWNTAARVLVGEKDAIEARRIAMEFDSRKVEAAANAHSRESSVDPPTREIDWPTCPGCGELRLVRCPICHTTGDDFEPVDMGFEWIPGLGEQAQAESAGCASGGCDCHGSHDKPADGESADKPSSDQPEEQLEGDEFGEDWAKNMLMCHMCNEPFAAEYSRTCAVCGHEFDDGIEIDPHDVLDDQIGHRAFVVVGGLLVIAVVIVAYFLVLY